MELLSRELDFSFYSAFTGDNKHGTTFRGPAVEVSIVLEGALTFMIDGQRRPVRGACATLQVYRDELRMIPDKGKFTRTMWCRFVADSLSEADWALLLGTPPILPVPTLLPNLFANAFFISQPGQRAAQAELAAHSVNFLGKAILSEYLRSADASPDRPPLPASVRQAKQILDREFEQSWTVGRLAKRVGANANYLIGLFRQHIGTPPMEYLWERRVDIGIHLLQTGQSTVEDVAFHCGFQSAAHFSRRIKKRTGASPRELRVEEQCPSSAPERGSRQAHRPVRDG